MNVNIGRKIWKELIINNFRRNVEIYEIPGIDCKIHVGKEKITLVNNKIGLEKSFNNAQVLEVLIKKYDDFKIVGSVILFFGYYSFICNQNNYLFAEQIKNIKKITPKYYQTLEFNANRLARSTQLFSDALAASIRNMHEEYRRAEKIRINEDSRNIIETFITMNDCLRRGR